MMTEGAAKLHHASERLSMVVLQLDQPWECLMHEPDFRVTFENYLGAFFADGATERERLIRSAVVEDVAFSNPGVDGHGVTQLLDHIEKFHERFGDGHFRINWLRQQHRQTLAEWTQFNEDGTEFITAHSYARYDENGRIVKFAGFWET